jgi:hypothetical protein
MTLAVATHQAYTAEVDEVLPMLRLIIFASAAQVDETPANNRAKATIKDTAETPNFDVLIACPPAEQILKRLQDFKDLP